MSYFTDRGPNYVTTGSECPLFIADFAVNTYQYFDMALISSEPPTFSGNNAELTEQYKLKKYNIEKLLPEINNGKSSYYYSKYSYYDKIKVYCDPDKWIANSPENLAKSGSYGSEKIILDARFNDNLPMTVIDLITSSSTRGCNSLATSVCTIDGVARTEYKTFVEADVTFLKVEYYGLLISIVPNEYRRGWLEYSNMYDGKLPEKHIFIPSNSVPERLFNFLTHIWPSGVKNPVIEPLTEDDMWNSEEFSVSAGIDTEFYPSTFLRKLFEGNSNYEASTKPFYGNFNIFIGVGKTVSPFQDNIDVIVDDVRFTSKTRSDRLNMLNRLVTVMPTAETVESGDPVIVRTKTLFKLPTLCWLTFFVDGKMRHVISMTSHTKDNSIRKFMVDYIRACSSEKPTGSFIENSDSIDEAFKLSSGESFKRYNKRLESYSFPVYSPNIMNLKSLGTNMFVHRTIEKQNSFFESLIYSMYCSEITDSDSGIDTLKRLMLQMKVRVCSELNSMATLGKKKFESDINEPYHDEYEATKPVRNWQTAAEGETLKSFLTKKDDTGYVRYSDKICFMDRDVELYRGTNTIGDSPRKVKGTESDLFVIDVIAQTIKINIVVLHRNSKGKYKAYYFRYLPTNLSCVFVHNRTGDNKYESLITKIGDDKVGMFRVDEFEERPLHNPWNRQSVDQRSITLAQDKIEGFSI